MGMQTIEQAWCHRHPRAKVGRLAARVERPFPSADRRAFIALTPGALFAWPSLLLAQSARTYRIGILEAIPATQNVANLDAFRRGLRDRGYVERRNVVIEYRSADGHGERFPELARELIRADVDVIVTRGTPATIAAKKATETIPIIMATMGDPTPIVSSFAHPGANVTGLTTFSTELSPKRVQLLKELVPTLARVGLLHDMSNAAARPEWDETLKAARAVGVDAELLDVRDESGFERAFAHATQAHVNGLVVGADGLTQMHWMSIVALADRMRLPTVYPSRDFVNVGGLMAYALDYVDLYYRFASFIDRIFKGARPGDLPIEQPARFELVINVVTARELRLTIPPEMRLRADALIG